MDKTIEEMKAWCLENYEMGADTMVECWSTEDYADMIREAASIEQAWETLRAVASVYHDRRMDAINSRF